jgi:hypothetical protein
MAERTDGLSLARSMARAEASDESKQDPGTRGNDE